MLSAIRSNTIQLVVNHVVPVVAILFSQNLKEGDEEIAVSTGIVQIGRCGVSELFFWDAADHLETELVRCEDLIFCSSSISHKFFDR